MTTPAELFSANQATTVVTSGGTAIPAPASGTQETWTVTSSLLFGTAATGVSQFHVADADPAYSGEIIAVTNVSGTTWTVTRGAENTLPVTHAPDFTVYQVTTAGFLSGVIVNPLTTLGDTVYGGISGTLTRLPGNSSMANKSLTQKGSGLGSGSSAPIWTAIGFLAGPVNYAPASVTTYNLGTSGFTALDATNLAVTFTAPDSGNVLVTLSGFVIEGGTGANIWFGLLSAGAIIGPTAQVLNSGMASQGLSVTSSHLVTGLTPSVFYTFEWAACADQSGCTMGAVNNGGSTSANPSNTTGAPATMTVQAA